MGNVFGVSDNVPAYFCFLTYYNNCYLFSPSQIFYLYLYLDLFESSVQSYRFAPTTVKKLIATHSNPHPPKKKKKKKKNRIFFAIIRGSLIIIFNKCSFDCYPLYPAWVNQD